MSRICVKGLAKTITEQELRDVFSQKGEITDVRIMKTKSNISRRFGFIGFRTADEAQMAISYFNQTYLHTCKIIVELAVKYESEKTTNQLSSTAIVPTTSAKSKHTKSKPEKIVRMNKGNEWNELTKSNSSNSLKANQENVDQQTSSLLLDKKVDLKQSRKEKEFIEFLSVMQSRKSSKVWGNDEVSPTELLKEKNKRIENSDDDDDDEDNDDDDDKSDSVTIKESDHFTSSKDDENDDRKDIMIKKISDMDFLKSKMTSTFKDEDDEHHKEDILYMNTKEPDSLHQNKNKNKEDKNDNQKNKVIFNPSATHERENKDQIVVENEHTANTINTITSTSNNHEIDDTGRLFVRNLPFSVNEEELKSLFEKYGNITEVHVPIDGDKKGKGYAFIQFMFPEHSIKAMNELDGTSFQGRLLHIIQAQSPREISTVESQNKALGKHLSSYQKKNEEERRKQINRKEGWNASFVRSDAVVESLAEKYGMKASDILDTNENAGELAIRLAIGETQVIQENRQYLASHGVNIEVLESNHSSRKSFTRSTTTLLVKNLPHDMIPDELESMFARHGTISSFLVPNSKTIALVDFVEPSEARIAFKALAYRSYHKQPLYIEWAVSDLLDKDKAARAHVADKMKKESSSLSLSSSKIQKISSSDHIMNDNNHHNDQDDDNYSTLFLKNLSFETTEDRLQQFLLKFGIQGIRVVSIPMKSKSSTSDNQMLSMGFGFIEFINTSYAEIALKKLDKVVLDGHTLEVKPSNKRISVTPTISISKKDRINRNTKLIVRNVPFQASQNEIRTLFTSFGSVKTVRIPKKMAGVHRGFAFIEFTTHQEALSAISSLANTHLYGRHLVIEWAKEEIDEDLNNLRKRAQGQEKVIQNINKKIKLDDYEGIDSGYSNKVGVGVGIGIGNRNKHDNEFDDEDDDKNHNGS